MNIHELYVAAQKVVGNAKVGIYGKGAIHPSTFSRYIYKDKNGARIKTSAPASVLKQIIEAAG